MYKLPFKDWGLILACWSLILTSLMGCERDLEQEKFNVFVYYSDNKEKYLGEVTGLSNCQSTASEGAYNLNLDDDDWDYMCCLKTSNSSCAEKHQ